MFLGLFDYILAATYLLILNKKIVLLKIKHFFIYFGFLIILLIYLYVFCLFAFPYTLLEIDYILLKFLFKENLPVILEFFKEHLFFILHSTWSFFYRSLVLTIYFIAENIGVPWRILIILVVTPIDFFLNIISHFFVDLDFYESCFIDFFFFIILIYKDLFNFFFTAIKLFSFTYLVENFIISFCFLPFFAILFILFTIIIIYNFYFIFPPLAICYSATFSYLFIKHQTYKQWDRFNYYLHPIAREVIDIFYYEIGPLLKLTYGNILIVIFVFIFIFAFIFFEIIRLFFNIWNDILDISIVEHEYADKAFVFVKEEQCYYIVPSVNDTFYLNDWFNEIMLLFAKTIVDTYQHHFFERYLYYGMNCMDYHLEFIRIFSLTIYGYYFMFFYFMAPVIFYFFLFYLVYSVCYIVAWPFEYLKSFVMSKRYSAVDKWNFQDPRTYSELVYPHVKCFLLSIYNDYSKLKNFNFFFIKYYLAHLKKCNFLLKKALLNINLIKFLKILILFFFKLPMKYLKYDLNQYYLLLYNIFKKYYDDAFYFERSVQDEERTYLTTFEVIYYCGCIFNWLACLVFCPTIIFYIFYFLNFLTTYKGLVFCGMLQIPCFFFIFYLVPFYSVKRDIYTIQLLLNKIYVNFLWLIKYFILDFNYNLLVKDLKYLIDKRTKNVQYIHEVHNLFLINTLFFYLLIYPFLYLSGWIRAKCLTTPELTKINMPFGMRFYHGFFSYVFQYYAYKGFDDLCEEYIQFTVNYRFWIFDTYLEFEKKNYKLILDGYIIHRPPLLNLVSWWLIFFKDFRLKSTRHKEIIQKILRDITQTNSLKFKEEYNKFLNIKSFILYKQKNVSKIDFVPYKNAFLILYFHSRFIQILELAQEYYLEIIKDRIEVPTYELLYFDTKKRLKEEKKKELQKKIKENKGRNPDLDIYDTLSLITKYSENWKRYSKSELLLASSEQKAYLFPEYIKKSFFNRVEEYLSTITLVKYVLDVGDFFFKADSNYKYSYHIKKRAARFNYYEREGLEILKYKWYNFKYSCRPIIHFKIPLHFYDYRMIYEFIKNINLITTYHINLKKNNIDTDSLIRLNNEHLLEIDLYYFFAKIKEEEIKNKIL